MSKIIIYHESFIKSLISDAFTFGMMLLCLWASWGSTGWTFISGVFMLIWLAARASFFTDSDKTLCTSLDDVQVWVDKQRRMES